VSSDNGHPRPKIIDFGIAVGTTREEQPDDSVRLAGTLPYMAPEQREHKQGIDIRADVYALGAVLARCLLLHSGVRLDSSQCFESTEARELLDGSLGRGWPGATAPSQETCTGGSGACQPSCGPLLRKAMAANREHRYQSAVELAEDLQRWLDAEPVRALGDSRLYRLRCFLRRNTVASVSAAVISLALIGGIVVALYGMTEAREGRSQAVEALALAEQRRRDAEELIEYMLGDFASQLRPIGRLDLLDSISAEALRYLTAQGAGDDRPVH
jgi:eukaryotic-like serine/threonine-protein kinase